VYISPEDKAMIDTLRKTIYAGIGATVISAEKLNAVLNELVEKGKLSSKEARELAGKIADEGRKEFEADSDKLGKAFDEWMKKANFARQKDVEALQARVARLEAQGGASQPQQQQQQ
jgi:polyhydroxyalkanoate synthesis regulator phasin